MNKEAIQPTLGNVDSSCLVIIDIQERLAAAMPPKVVQRMQRNTVLLLKAAALLDVPVIATLQYPNGLGQMLTPINNALPSETQVIEKTKFSCCGVAEFDKFLKDSNRSQIILVGMEMHICVMQTALELDASSDYQPWVVLDATGSRHRDSYDYSMSRLSSNGIAITETEAVLFEWLRDAGNPKFKEISALLR